MNEITKREGPSVRIHIDVSCSGCRHERSEYYCIEDGNDCDSGFNHYCTNPQAVAGGSQAARDRGVRHITHGTETPPWCPFREKAIADAKSKGGS